MTRRLARQLERTLDEGSGSHRSVIVRMKLPEKDEETLLGAVAHAVQRRALLPVSSWDFQGPGPHPSGWTVQAVVNGPSEAVTLYRPWASVIFCKWGNLTGRAFAGRGPLAWAHTSARLQSETERSLADEAGGPVANLVTVPQDGGDGSEDDPLKELKADLKTARGRALLLETTAAGWGEGRSAAPLRDWKPERLGPNPPASLAGLMEGD